VNRIVDVLILDGLLIEMLCEKYFFKENSNNFIHQYQKNAAKENHDYDEYLENAILNTFVA